MARLLVVLALGVLVGALAQLVRLPGAWLIGPMLVGIVASVAGAPARLPRWVLLASQGVVGMLVAGSFDPATLPRIAASWPAVVIAVGGTLVASAAVGLGLARISSLGRETATLGTLPGGAPAMIAMSLELGADTPAVAVMQYFRIVVAVLSASLIGRLALELGVAAQAGVAPPSTLAAPGVGLPTYALTAAVALVGVSLGARSGFPAGVILGPLVLGLAAAELGGLRPAWPIAVPELAYALLGLYVGAMFDTTALRLIRRQLPAMLASIVALIALCAALGGLLATLTGADYLTCLLATTPGGLDSVVAIGLTSGADVSLMLSVQLVRLFAVLLLAPSLARWLLRRGAAEPS